MLKIKQFTFNPFQENTYVISEPGGKCIIIDAGCYMPQEERAISEYFASEGLNPVMALNTHGHIDHILGITYLKEKHGVKFALRGEDKFLVESAPEHGKIYGFQLSTAPQVDIDLTDNSELQLGEHTLQLIHTPGHTPGHICIFDPENRTLFCGDTLFRESIGRTDLPGGDYSWIMRSILEKIIPLGEDVRLCPGHGPGSTIGHEVLYNPFITEVIQGDVNF